MPQTTAQQQWYQRNREPHKAAMELVRQERRAFVNAYKSSRSCVDCGLRFHPVCMDFDHPPGAKENGSKKGTVSYLVAAHATEDRLLEEMEKCELRCANCHRLKHHYHEADDG